MTFVVLENCIKCTPTDCVDVCPVDCFHEGPIFWSSTPRNASTARCANPSARSEAIVSEDDIPAGQEQFPRTQRGAVARMAGHHQSKPPPDDAEEWEGVPDKLQYLER